METKDTAAALLKEWRHQEIASSPFSSWAWDSEYQKELSQRLDEISGASGISIGENGGFKYKLHGHILSPFFELKDYYGEAIPAREQQAIQEWLLIKNEEKTA